MAYEKFIAEVESMKMLKERDKYLIFGDHCTRKWEGEISKKGDQIRIRGLGEPTIYTLNKDGSYSANEVGTGSIEGTGKEVIQGGIPYAEEIKNTEVLLKVNQLATWNLKIGDIDKELTSQYGLMPKYRKKAARKIAYAQDLYIASTIVGYSDCENTDSSCYTNGTGTYLTAGDTDTSGETNYYNILDFIDAQVQGFNEVDVDDDVKIVAECSPKFWRYLKKALRTIDTDNSTLIKGRKVTEYNGIYFYKTNQSTISSTEYFILRTTEAVAFFDPLSKSEPYRPERGFEDCWKGFSLFDAGIVAPKEIKWSKVLGYAS